jgi:hypothetical protein
MNLLNTLPSGLESKQLEMQERQKVARSQRAKKIAGNRKRKRTRVSIKGQLIDLAMSPRANAKVRAWAIQQQLLLQGKPVQPFEELHDEEPKPEEPRISGADLGPVAPRS